MNDLTTSRMSGQEDTEQYRQLAEELAEAIEGEVRFDAGSRALYANDASNYRQPPIGVTIPAHGVPILARRRHQPLEKRSITPW
ncbi:hypothetical protein HSBAA_09280 [Vreelandella sulfidaeris]|uniref:Uncharacterized protein n=1 Tax=Vreelandella sulfidaeris TaxID=115553 RepID=A0A455U0Z6_9GAMM|nr:hypothetical protein HSBAA_09280 [Halomonas sulfidaeris]